MMAARTLDLFLASDAETTRFGTCLAPLLERGDAVLLSGEVGAGKSHLARAIIRERLGRMEDVPSPTFTLVQTYEAGPVEIWHADLYRLTVRDEIAELGLEAAFATAICLVEWPDRLGDTTPQNALEIELLPEGESRRAVVRRGRAGLVSALRTAWCRHG